MFFEEFYRGESPILHHQFGRICCFIFVARILCKSKWLVVFSKGVSSLDENVARVFIRGLLKVSIIPIFQMTSYIQNV